MANVILLERGMIKLSLFLICILLKEGRILIKLEINLSLGLFKSKKNLGSKPRKELLTF